MKKPSNKNIVIFLFIIFVLGAIFFFIGDYQEKRAIELQIQKEELRLVELQNILSQLPIHAKAVSIYDITAQKEIYGKNSDEPLPLASLVKTMTIMIALENYDLDDQIIISKNALKEVGDNGLFLNERWKVHELVKFTLIISSNDGAVALSESDKDFVEKMNEKAKKIGIQNTWFLDVTGFDLSPSQAGAMASARDVNIMNSFALKNYPEIFSTTTLKEADFISDSGLEHKIENTNIIVDKIPNLLFSKTGLTNLAGGNLSIIFKNTEGHKIAITVLGSTPEGRFSDMEKLINVL